MSLSPGVYPALVTPFDAKGRVDFVSVARLMARAEAHGCTGVVLSGTTGEGPSLSAVEKRDLILESVSLRGSLSVILGLATNSLDEAIWLCKRAAEFECAAVLVMPPTFFREAPAEGVLKWMSAVLEASPIPVLAYHFPKYSYSFSPSDLAALAGHANFAGLKDSSGDLANLGPFRQAVGHHHLLFTGNEMILPEAREAGWNGSISGNANLLGGWIGALWRDEMESAQTKREILKPVSAALREAGLTGVLKGLLADLGVLSLPDVRPPLLPCNPEAVEGVKKVIEDRLGPLQ